MHDLVDNDFINWDMNDIVEETIHTNILISWQGNIIEEDDEFIGNDDVDDVWLIILVNK